MTTPVTIVTPSYNQAAYLEATIESVLAQDYADLECLVVDDGSTDGSVELAQRYANRLTFVQQRNAGQVAALNNGFGRARGEILGWLNSDDMLLPGAVAAVVEALEADPGALLVYGDNIFVDASGDELFRLRAREFDPAAMVRACDNHVPQPGSLFRRRALELAPLNERGYYFFDFEFVLRLSEHGTVKRIERVLGCYRVHPEAKTIGAPVKKAEDYVRIADEFFATPLLPTSLRPFAEEARRTAYTHAAEYFYEGLDLGRARRYALRARALPLALRTLLPAPLVRSLRARRRPASPVPSVPS